MIVECTGCLLPRAGLLWLWLYIEGYSVILQSKLEISTSPQLGAAQTASILFRTEKLTLRKYDRNIGDKLVAMGKS